MLRLLTKRNDKNETVLNHLMLFISYNITYKLKCIENDLHKTLKAFNPN